MDPDSTSSTFSEYSTTVIRSHTSRQATTTQTPSLSSILTIRPSPDPNQSPDSILPATPQSLSSSSDSASLTSPPVSASPEDPLGTSSLLSIASLDSYHTAQSSSIISSALATQGGSTIRSLHANYVTPMVHRFTLYKPGIKPKRNSGSMLSPNGASNGGEAVGWNPFDLFFSSGLLVAKCDICAKRLGWKPVLECDDCGLRCVPFFTLHSLITSVHANPNTSSVLQNPHQMRRTRPSRLRYTSCRAPISVPVPSPRHIPTLQSEAERRQRWCEIEIEI